MWCTSAPVGRCSATAVRRRTRRSAGDSAELPPLRRRVAHADRAAPRAAGDRRRRLPRHGRRWLSSDLVGGASAAAESADPVAQFADPDAVAVVLFTSGTTSAPKAVELTHNNLTSYITGTVEFDSAQPGDAALICVPPYHIAGVSAALSNLYAGRKMVYLSAFDAAEWVRLVDAEAVSSATVVPTMLDRIVTALEAASTTLPTLRTLAYGGSKVALPLVRRALALLPEVGFVNAYGLTETSSTIAVLTPEDHRVALTSDDPVCCAASARSGGPCRPSRFRSAARTAPSSARTSPANCSSAASRSRAATPASDRSSTPTAGFPPATWPTWTPTATCSSAAAPTTRSSAAGRTSPPPRSRTSSSNTRMCTIAPSSAPMTRSGARLPSLSSCPHGVPNPDLEVCAASCAADCAGRAPRTGSSFGTELPTNATGKVLRRNIVESLQQVDAPK